jgi:DHA3 family macrolide efflux protein-like MFS transporter
VTCSVSLLCLAYVTRGMLEAARDKRPNVLRRSADGLLMLRDNVPVRYLFISAFVIDFTFGWPFSAALPLLSDQRGWGVAAVGTVIAAFSAGALFSTALGSLIAHRLSLTFRFGVTACVIAAGLLTMALMPTVVAMAAVAAVIGMASGLNGPSIITLYQALVPKDRMGAAMATLALAGIGTAPFSVALFGAVAMLVGTQATWVICGILATTGPAMAFAALRRASHPELVASPEPRVPATSQA